MIEQTVKIVALDGDYAWIESLSLHGCAKCDAGEGCGGGIFAKLFGDKQFRMKILNDLDLGLNDNVVIGVEDSTVTNASLISYLLPIMGLFVGAALGYQFDVAGSEFWTLSGSLMGFSLAFIFVQSIMKNSNSRAKYTPIMLRKQNILEQFEPSSG